jgi:oxaloacetate decarboxylase alpha subunit
VETLLAIFDETNYSANLDRDALRKVGKFFFNLKKLREPAMGVGSYVDPDILQHHIPGGMISNLRSQLQQQNALDRLDEVLEELPRARADLGYPPLVTPTSQIVGVQAVLNVLSGDRYSMVTQETRDYVKGLYGRAPAPIDPKIKKKILGDEKTIDCRPADLLPPMLPGACDNVDPKLIRGEEDILSFCLFPEPALEYFAWRELPPGERPAIPADEEEAKRKKSPAAPAEPTAKPLMAPSDYAALQSLLTTVTQLGIVELTVRRPDAAVTLRGSGAAPSAADTSAAPLAAASAASTPVVAAPALAPVVPDLPSINAPLTGTFYRTSGLNKPNLVEEGAEVKAGDPVCIIEAMKLFNQIKADRKCKVVRFLVKHGTVVQKGTPLAAVEYV